MATFRVKATKDEIFSWEDAFGKHRQVARKTRTITCISKESALSVAKILNAAGWAYVQVTTNRGAHHLIRYQDGQVTYDATQS